ncbi:MAG TPA: SDR family oxidoreductase [Methylomirabilota bacterium]|nr:SDR family oxidoreductase [Methylomirabilota bacterium]
MRDSPVLVTGATGYVGGRLVPRLLDAGHRVRCLARSAPKLAARPWAGDPRVEIVESDLTDTEATVSAMHGCHAAYYLVHSMVSTGAGYAAADRQLAHRFTTAAARTGVGRIIYLGGLGERGQGLSEHLASRRDVEAVLAAGPLPVTVFRAAMIIGSGSASFEILRYLVERLPVMVTPRWVKTASQPIAISNVLTYLVACLSVPSTVGRTLDIGGPDVVSYLDLMRIMAEERGLRRRVVIPVPVLTPGLSSRWIQLVTPVSHQIARPLAEGLRNPVVCGDNEAARLMPQRLLGVREAIRVALAQVAHREVETGWFDAGPIPGDPDWAGGTVFSDRREVEVVARPADVFAAVSRIGGETGWYSAPWLWRLRGALDRLTGGPGLRRGRRDAERMAFGDAVDFWRVTGIEQGRWLALRAEMRLPGDALLEFAVESSPGRPDRCRLVQTARFLPRGLLGLAYWYVVLPAHRFVFGRMLEGIRRVAEGFAASSSTRGRRG